MGEGGLLVVVGAPAKEVVGSCVEAEGLLEGDGVLLETCGGSPLECKGSGFVSRIVIKSCSPSSFTPRSDSDTPSSKVSRFRGCGG